MNIPRALAVLTFAALAAPCLGGSAPTPRPATIPPEMAPHVPRNLQNYFVVFLVTPDDPRPLPFDLFVRHQAYIRSQIEAGVFHIVGPVTDGGRIRGMKILSANSAEEAQAIAEADPAVQAGVFAVELHPAVFPSLSTLRVEYSPRD